VSSGPSQVDSTPAQLDSRTCQVDFYVLQDPRKSASHLACQLALMAWEQGMRSMLLVTDTQQAAHLDDLMWSVPNGRFLPHQLCGDGSSSGQATPIVIGKRQDLAQVQVELVINLDTEPVPGPGRFRRLLELVPARESDRQASRLKFRSYREAGLDPVSHNMT
jgi:DNA polymerase-3 subunit chi